MKLATVDDRATLVVERDGSPGFVDVAAASDGRFGPDPMELLERWAEVSAWSADLAPTALGSADVVPLDQTRLGPPVPRPRQVFGIGVNYRTHAEETGSETHAIPPVFTKFPTCLNSPYAQVVLPSGWVDWEVELVAVIGVRCDHVAAADALAHVAGWTVGQDLSERRVQMQAGAQFSLGKSYRGFGPMGPWLVGRDELPDAGDLAIGCTIDGETMQAARTSEMIFDVPHLIEELSSRLTLLPGDVIFTGTPAGVGVARDPRRFLAPGEVLESTIEGIGTIRQTFVAG